MEGVRIRTRSLRLHFGKIALAWRWLVTACLQVYLHRNTDGDGTMKLTGIHHLTAVTANASGNHAFYTQRARHAAGQEDGEPGRRQRLSPVLCGRAGLARHRHHLLRLAGRARAARHAQHRPHRPARDGATALALVEATASDAWTSRTARSSSATGGSRSTSRIPRASASASSTTAARASPIPGSAARFRPSTRSAASARSRISVPKLERTARGADARS